MLKANSKKVEPGDTFIAIKSKVRDGHDYIEEAIEKGAACIIAERGEYNVKTIIVSDTKAYLAKYLKELYADKLNKIKLIGITGTNGKTTSCYFTYQLLNKLGVKTAYIGTIGFFLPNKHTPLVNTTPDLYDLYEMIVEAVNEECQVVIMEASSQALDSRRLERIKFNIAVFTNITEDHLDYHHSMKEYQLAKLKLFSSVKDYTIINIDDPHGKNFISEKNKNILIGQQECDYRLSDITLSETRSTFKITHKGETKDIILPIPGMYNIYNYLNAYVICDKLCLNEDDIIRETLNLKTPKGRYQVINNDKFTVIVDYAHTPDAVLKIINSVKAYAKGRILTLIGCGGDRDKEKRPVMGKIATDYSDFVFFTSDNPRTEDPEAIINDMIQSVEKQNYEIIVDRVEAIKKAISTLTENDILLVLGKGHEDYQIIGTEKTYLNDAEEVLKYVKLVTKK